MSNKFENSVSYQPSSIQSLIERARAGFSAWQDYQYDIQLADYVAKMNARVQPWYKRMFGVKTPQITLDDAKKLYDEARPICWFGENMWMDEIKDSIENRARRLWKDASALEDAIIEGDMAYVKASDAEALRSWATWKRPDDAA